MTCIVTRDGKRCLTLISCHDNNTFSFYRYDRWITARTVPAEVLNDPELPEGERRRVQAKMDWLGVVPS
jgi:hypothetical protein